ncbi:MAG: B12-binding domain-containing radical SAM protein [Clostridia bacterium]|nr:B12-binding domain-containing radical SAM protein [Clostridia bacterium]MBN2882179.1 B12-binding domain-containing radical SAM protein [Clostridia bacterium]
MKILLVTPSQPKTSTRWIPVGIAYLASSLKSKGHDARIYDRHRMDFIFNDKSRLNSDFRSEILSYEPDIIGFSTVSPLIYDTVESIDFVRTFYDRTIIAGGHHATAMPMEILSKIPGLDFVIAGEGELSLSELADGLQPEIIPGVFTRTTDPKVFINSRIDDLDSLPYPDYSVFDMDFYTKANANTIRGHYLKTADVLSSRGCTNNCSFCSETLTYGRGVRFHSPDYIIECIERLLADYDINAIYFHDNDFLISRKHAEEICHLLISKGLNKKIRWAVQAGTDKADDDMFRLMSESGCIAIEFGMESIKQSDLNNINKNRFVSMNEKAVSLCKKNGISAHSYFMIGLERETLDDLNALLKWIKKYQPQSFLLSSLMIHPGTELYQSHGNAYFENNEWTKSNVTSYYNSNPLYEIDHETFKIWEEEVMKPFRSKHHRKWIIRNNSLMSLLRIVLEKATLGSNRT